MAMDVEPEQVVALIRYKSEYTYFSAESDYWFLDQYMVKDAFEKNGHVFPEIPAEFRNGMLQVRPCDGEGFLNALRNAGSCVSEFKVEADSIRLEHELLPSVLIDFDERVFKSFHPEPYGFEKYAGEGWNSSYTNFHDEVPLALRYW